MSIPNEIRRQFPELDVVMTLTDLRGERAPHSWRFPWERSGDAWLDSQRTLIGYTLEAADVVRSWRRTIPEDEGRVIPWIRDALDLGDTTYPKLRVVGPGGAMVTLITTLERRQDEDEDDEEHAFGEPACGLGLVLPEGTLYCERPEGHMGDHRGAGHHWENAAG